MYPNFATAVVRWQKKHGRQNLPWQGDNPYHIWLSEIMLQQTQVATVLPYYHRFLRRFPDIGHLARARENSVLAAWSGLGYYARARNLHRAAKIIVRDGFPTTAAAWQQLPGVGRSTAAALSVFISGERAAILDGNVRRVLARVFAFAQPLDDAAQVNELWALADSLLPPADKIKGYTQGMMDLGAMVCLRTRPKCLVCPLAAQCMASQQGTAEQFPTRRRRIVKQQWQADFVLIHCNARVLLQKRAPSGIWGGLWCLPEIKKKPPQQWTDLFALRRQGEYSFTHEFTHRHLRARVLSYECRKMAPPPSGLAWFLRRDLATAALPAPIKKLLTASVAQEAKKH